MAIHTTCIARPTAMSPVSIGPIRTMMGKSQTRRNHSSEATQRAHSGSSATGTSRPDSRRFEVTRCSSRSARTTSSAFSTTSLPASARSIKDATVDYVDELSRLGVLSDDVDLPACPASSSPTTG